MIDEAAMVANLEQAWQQSIRPTLTDLRGQAWFLSTPKGMNYFKHLFDRGQDRSNLDWASWQMPTAVNPYIDSQEIEAARRDLTEAAFNQEYLALFVNWEGSVFRHVGRRGQCPVRSPAPGRPPVCCRLRQGTLLRLCGVSSIGSERAGRGGNGPFSPGRLQAAMRASEDPSRTMAADPDHR